MTLLKTIFILLVTCILTGCTALRKPEVQCPPDNPFVAGCITKCNDQPCVQYCADKTPCEQICKACPEIDCRLPDTMEGQLLCAATSIERSLNILAGAEVAENPPIIQTAPLVTPEGGMGCRARIDWSGPIEPLLCKIAKITNYRLKVLGNEPAIPIIVTITANRGIVAEILQNAAFQAQKRAHVMVFPENRIIELRYCLP